MGKTCEHQTARQLVSRISGWCVEVAEQHRFPAGRVIRILLSNGVRVNSQSLNKPISKPPNVSPVTVFLSLSPRDSSTQNPLKILDGVHRDSVHHLLMKLRIARRWRQTVRRQQSVEFPAIVTATTGRIEVHNFKVIADRAGFEIVLPFDFQNTPADHRCVQTDVSRRIE